MRRFSATFLLALALAGAVVNFAAQGQPGTLRVLSREGSRALPTTSIGTQEYVALDDVASTFGLALKEDKLAGGITASSGGRTIIITADQPVVSVNGRLVSLPAAPTRQGTRWLLPLDFLQRALGPVLETRVELRRASRLVVVGDVRVPRVTVRVEATGSGATATFEISPAAPARVSQENGRIVVNVDADAIDLQTSAVPPQEFLQAVQPGDAPASVRLVPGAKFGVHRATTSQPDASSSRLVVDLLPAGAEPPPATPQPTAPAAPAPVDPLPLPVPAAGLRTVVIDPGHGGDEAGARGPGGTLEKDITLQVARRLRALIETRLGLRVFLTRDDDRSMALDERAAYANSQKADVFLSIHANAALRPALKGAEVYYLDAEGMSDGERGDGEATVLPVLGGGSRNIELLRWDTAQVGSVQLSSSLAGLIEQALRGRIEMSPRAVQRAPFRVLVGASMPAALVEIGYLSNPEQEQALSSAAYQDQIAQALFEAIVAFRVQLERASRGPR